MAPFEWRINYNLGLCHMQQKQYASAFQFLSAAVNLNPGHAQGFMLLGSALMYLEDEANAVGAFERALDLDR
jgi:Bardet-Biedl syndrome 4 protein